MNCEYKTCQSIVWGPETILSTTSLLNLDRPNQFSIRTSMCNGCSTHSKVRRLDVVQHVVNELRHKRFSGSKITWTFSPHAQTRVLSWENDCDWCCCTMGGERVHWHCRADGIVMHMRDASSALHRLWIWISIENLLFCSIRVQRRHPVPIEKRSKSTHTDMPEREPSLWIYANTNLAFFCRRN